MIISDGAQFLEHVRVGMVFWYLHFQAGERAGSVCLDRFSGLIGGVSAGFRPPRSAAGE
jgi:hypothetical protein